MAAFARMITAPLLLALHYLAVVPLHAARSLWIASKVGLPSALVSQLSAVCSEGFNMVGFVKTIEDPVVAGLTHPLGQAPARPRQVVFQQVVRRGCAALGLPKHPSFYITTPQVIVRWRSSGFVCTAARTHARPRSAFGVRVVRPTAPKKHTHSGAV